MDVTCTCCCGAEVSVTTGTCHECAMARCSMEWCERNDAPAVGTEEDDD